MLSEVGSYECSHGICSDECEGDLPWEGLAAIEGIADSQCLYEEEMGEPEGFLTGIKTGHPLKQFHQSQHHRVATSRPQD